MAHAEDLSAMVAQCTAARGYVEGVQDVSEVGNIQEMDGHFGR